MENIVEAGKMPLKCSGRMLGFDISKDGKTAYIAEDNGLKMLDISDPTDIYQVGGYFHTDGMANDVTLSNDGTKAYIADDRNGVVIVDIRDKNKLSVISNIEMRNTEDIALSEDEKTLVSVGTLEKRLDHLTIFDISYPAHPTKIGSYDIDNSTFGVELSKDGTKAYLAKFGALVIVDISNPSKPVKIGEYATDSSVFRIALSKDETKAYLTNGSNGLLIIDITNPAKPTKIGEHRNVINACSIRLSSDGTKIYVDSFDDDAWEYIIVGFDIVETNTSSTKTKEREG